MVRLQRVGREMRMLVENSDDHWAHTVKSGPSWVIHGWSRWFERAMLVDRAAPYGGSDSR